MPYLPEKYNPMLLDDIGYKETDEILDNMIAEVESRYSQAAQEAKKNALDYLQWFIAADLLMHKKFLNLEITAREYADWRHNKILTGQHWYAMSGQLATNYTNANLIAASIINGYLPQVYAINGNWTTYTIEHELGITTAFTLYDEQTVERLIRKKPDLLPKASIDIPKDMRWNKEQMVSAVTQGIIQGDSVEELADRLVSVTNMNKKAAIRNAVTMTTSAQNAGRIDSYKRAIEMGINCKKRWLATLDGHTRPTHRQCDGIMIDVNKKFPNGLLYPGDPDGKAGEVYNCRCCLIAAFDDQPFTNDDRAQDIYKPNSKVRNMTYDQWKKSKGGEPLFKSARNVNRDMDMHDEYKKLLGSKVPNNFREFQELKYGDPVSWKKMKSDARKARNKARE